MKRLTVYLFRREGRKHFECQWRDPVTGRLKTKTTGTAIKRDAERFRVRLEDELLKGEWFDAGNVTWEDFRRRFEKEYGTAISEKAGDTYKTVFNHVEKYVAPKFLAAVDSVQISRMTAKLRERSISEVSIKTYLTHLKAALGWAVRQKMLRKIPAMEIPTVRPRMKGRPITDAEFERMLSKTSAVVGSEVVAEWQWFLRGLWLSGLRIGEAAILSWDDGAPFAVDLSHEFPMFRIESEAEKGKQDRLLPMTPDFAEMIQTVPDDRRVGLVLLPPRSPTQAHHEGPLGTGWCSKTIAEIGRLAEVKVSDRGRKAKHASAHDFRRAFGYRWAQRVMPPVLQILMRHEDLKTTMTYYVGRNAADTARTVWQAFTSQSPNTPAAAEPRPGNDSAKTPRKSGSKGTSGKDRSGRSS